MKNLSPTITSAIISFILVLPFILLELVNRQNFQEEFPFVLFAALWILQLTFIITLMPIKQNLWPGKSSRLDLRSLMLRVPFLIVIACIWAGLILDQMPCFLGVPNCD